MERLTGVIQHYAWGSPSAIPALMGIPEDGRPQAELWLGAHPSAPARVGDRALDELITSAPGIVGDASVARFGPRLPYLIKVLAAEQPLSLQAHPSRTEAEEGFAREEAAGLPRDAGTRNYKDDWPKPEMLVALEDFEALYGFADPSVVADHFTRLGVPEVSRLVAPLSEPGGEAGIREVFLTLCRLPNERRHLVAEVVAAAANLQPLEGDRGSDRAFATFCRTAVELAEHAPGDPGVVAALLMNRVTLRAGEAIYLPAGNLHAYLRGTGVEIMANSDNVLRGGLTPKHVDVAELGRVLDFTPVRPELVTAVEDSPGVWRYRTPAPEFRLWRIELGDREVELPATPYGRIVLVIEGTATLAGTTLDRGDAGWLAAGEDAGVSGDGTLFVGAPGLD